MDYWLQLRELIPLGAFVMIGGIAIALIFRHELRRQSRRALIVFLGGVVAATVAAQKGADGTGAAYSPLMRMPPVPVVTPAIADDPGLSSATNFPPVTNLCFIGIEKNADAVVPFAVVNRGNLASAAKRIVRYALGVHVEVADDGYEDDVHCLMVLTFYHILQRPNGRLGTRICYNS